MLPAPAGDTGASGGEGGHGAHPDFGSTAKGSSSPRRGGDARVASPDPRGQQRHQHPRSRAERPGRRAHGRAGQERGWEPPQAPVPGARARSWRQNWESSVLPSAPGEGDGIPAAERKSHVPSPTPPGDGQPSCGLSSPPTLRIRPPPTCGPGRAPGPAATARLIPVAPALGARAPQRAVSAPPLPSSTTTQSAVRSGAGHHPTTCS